MKYRYRLEERRERRLGFIRLIRRLAIFALVLIMFYTLFLYTGGRPQVSDNSIKSLSLIPLQKTFKIEVNKPIRELRLYVEQDGNEKEIYHLKLSEPSKEVSFTLNAKTAGLKDGNANVLLKVSSGFLQERTYKIDAYVDTVPPRFRVLSYTPSPSMGGSGAIKIKAEEDGTAYAKIGEWQYPLYPVGNGYYFGMFPIRLDLPEISTLQVVFTDRAGNTATHTLSLKAKTVRFKEDKISIDDEFINKVVYPLLGEEGKGLEPLEAFRKVNEVWRTRDVGRLAEVGRKSEPRILWEGAFLQLPHSKVFATYGDIRHYYYQGQKVSESRHMGFDFASVEMAPVPASNSGVVVFIGDLGIYGNTVVIDHGMGLMSLYGHLSEVHVKEGQYVKKGEIIGKTGKTGLALGDHLHFGILLHGYEVNPVEWLDQKWIRNNILSVFEAR